MVHHLEGKWSFNEYEDGSWNNETFDTKEEAIEAAQEYFCKYQTSMFIGQFQSVPLPIDVDCDPILEQLDEYYDEKCWDGNDEYLFKGVKAEVMYWLENKLSELIQQFYVLAEIESPVCNVVNVEKITQSKEEK